jgi:hypothetical protein
VLEILSKRWILCPGKLQFSIRQSPRGLYFGPSSWEIISPLLAIPSRTKSIFWAEGIMSLTLSPFYFAIYLFLSSLLVFSISQVDTPTPTLRAFYVKPLKCLEV